ncbi:MAG: Fe-S cluster assembly protein SufB [Bacilli bacterium]|nr:Fe-S cluster assembly protein SufB [Bacilli bacterium]
MVEEIELGKGLNINTVKTISKLKNEPKWMTDFRINSYKAFEKMNMPSFGPKLDINFNNIHYYKRINDKVFNNWESVRCDVKNTFDKIGIIDAEKKYLGGVTTQFESEAIYHNMLDEIKEKGIIFTDTDTALKEHPEIFKKYFNTLVKYNENKFTALNGCVWSGGSFIYIPPNTKLDRPLQSYFRINTKDMGQFERTLIIVDDNSELHYIEGCTAPTYTTDSLHAAVVEIFVGKNAKCRYTTIQNWASNIYNLVTKRAIVDENGLMEWIDGNIGAKINMKYPACILNGNGAKGTCISIAMADEGQIQDTGARMIHNAPNTKSNIIAKSIARHTGNATYRGTVRIKEGAINSIANIKCDTILLDETAKSDTIPKNIILNDSSTLEHEATVSKVSDDKLFYMKTKGIDEDKAREMIIMGFIDEFRDELPMEYAVELNNLLKNKF